MDFSSLYFFAPTEMELLHTWSDKTNRWIIENFVLLGSLWSDLPNRQSFIKVTFIFRSKKTLISIHTNTSWCFKITFFGSKPWSHIGESGQIAWELRGKVIPCSQHYCGILHRQWQYFFRWEHWVPRSPASRLQNIGMVLHCWHKCFRRILIFIDS